jgi:hypothetical protein
MGSSILLALASAFALQPDNPVFPKDLTCHDAADAEAQYGAQPQADLDRALAIGGPFVFKRPFRGIPASIVYLCNSDRQVLVRLIYVQFASQEAATAAFDTYRSAFTMQFGAPCGPQKSVSFPQEQEASASPPQGNVGHTTSRVEGTTRCDNRAHVAPRRQSATFG